MSSEEQDVKIVTSDDVEFIVGFIDLLLVQRFNFLRQVSPKIANQSKLLADFVVLNQREPIPLKNVTSEIFKKVIEWCEYHAEDIPKPPDNVEEKRTDDIGEWDVEFLKVDKGTLFELVLVSSQLSRGYSSNVAKFM